MKKSSLLLLIYTSACFLLNYTASSQTQLSMLFIRANYSDNPSEVTISLGDATALVNGLADYFEEVSYGTISLNPTVTSQILTINHPRPSILTSLCSVSSDCVGAAADHGYSPYSYDFVLSYAGSTPMQPGIGNSIGRVCGEGSTAFVIVNVSSALAVGNVWAHEIFHTFANQGHQSSYRNLGLTATAGIKKVSYNVFNIMGETGGYASTVETLISSSYGLHTVQKYEVGWLPNDSILDIATSGQYTIYAHDVPTIQTDRKYAFRIITDSNIPLYGETRHKPYHVSSKAASYIENGLLLYAAESAGNNYLVDCRPDMEISDDISLLNAPLTIGKTFSDFGLGLHITPIAVNSAGTINKSIQLQVNIGDFTGNLPPSVNAFTADTLTASVSEPISFTISATDLNGDPLAYDWDFGDDSVGNNLPAVIKSWSQEGFYTVRCQVSDMKGGTTSRIILVTIGTPDQFVLQGTVGVEGAFVRYYPINATESLAVGYSDDSGIYNLVLPNSEANNDYSITVQKYGYSFSPVSSSVTDFSSSPLPQINVDTMISSTEESCDPVPGVFRISRNGNASQNLLLQLSIGGNASNTDYLLTHDGQPLAGNSVTIPAGMSYIDLELLPLDDASPNESDERVTLFLFDSQTKFNTSPSYIPGPSPTGTIVIHEPTASTVLNFSSSMTVLAESTPVQQASVTITRTGPLTQTLNVPIALDGTANFGGDYQILVDGTPIYSNPFFLSIPSGAGGKTFYIHINDDNAPEEQETLSLSILCSPLYDRGSNLDFSIDSDDVAQLAIVLDGSTTLSESLLQINHTSTLKLIRDPSALSVPLHVRYHLLETTLQTGVSAILNSDFTMEPVFSPSIIEQDGVETITIPPDFDTVWITISAIDDTWYGGTSTKHFDLHILPAPHYTIIGPQQLEFTIEEDDTSLPMFTGGIMEANGHLTMRFHGGQPGNLVLQQSEDMIQWSNFSEPNWDPNNPTISQGMFAAESSLPLSSDRGFYRIKVGTVSSPHYFGFVKKSMPPGFTFMANPLNSFSSYGYGLTLENVLQHLVVPSGCEPEIRLFNTSQSDFETVSKYINGDWTNPDIVLNPGIGFMFYNPSQQDCHVTFFGEVPHGTLSASLQPGFNSVAAHLPQSGGLTSVLGFSPDGFGEVQKWNGSQFESYSFQTDGATIDWWPSEPKLQIAEGIIINLSSAATWATSFNPWWDINLHMPQIANNQFLFDALNVPDNTDGEIQHSADLRQWNKIEDLTSSGNSISTSYAVMDGPNFFRVRFGQNLSAQAVGYYKKAYSQGFHAIANQFIHASGNNTLNNVLPNVPQNSTIEFWNTVNQSFDDEEIFDGLKWVSGIGGPISTASLDPGQGVFLYLPTVMTITLAGTVSSGSFSQLLPQHYSLISHHFPWSIGVTAAGFPAESNDQILLWNSMAQTYYPSLNYYYFPPFDGWYNSNFEIEEPTPNISEAFFYNSASPLSKTWQKTYVVWE